MRMNWASAPGPNDRWRSDHADVLVEVMQQHPRSNLTVLCGHTHGGGEVQVLPNLRVLTGEAEYGDPAIQQVLEID